MEQAPRFFVSFSSHDRKYVREIMAALKGQELEVWDYSDLVESIELGESIDQRLCGEIDSCSHMVVVISENSMNARIGRFCRLELEYARNKKVGAAPHFIPVLVESPQSGSLRMIDKAFSYFKNSSVQSKNQLKLKAPYDIFSKDFCYDLDETPESIVNFTAKVCQVIGKVYIPPIEAHAKLPFWKLFRKEVEEMAHSNKVHVDVMLTLGEFNEYYRKAQMQPALQRIRYFIDTCELRVKYTPFYPWIVKAVCETELGMFDEAMKSYEKAKTIFPEDQDVIGGIGTLYFKTGQYHKAAECFEQIIRNNATEGTSNARINLIISKQAMEDRITDEEEKFLFKVNIESYPDDLKTAIFNAQAMQLRIKKDYSTLEKHCTEIISKNLHDTITIRLLQLSYLNRGLTFDAKRVIDKAVEEAEYNLRLDKDMLKKFRE